MSNEIASPSSVEAVRQQDESPKRRILIIDDNDAIHGDFRKTLSPQTGADLSADEAALFGDTAPAPTTTHFEIDSALQGEEGLAKVEAAVRAGQPYQVAFVDMRMPPGWDGVKTIQKLWAADPLLQVVICTAYSDYSWEQIIHELGATDRLLILKKPFDEAEVCQLATALTEKWLVTRQANLKQTEMEAIIDARTAELKKAAFHDKLTGLPNRQLLNDRLARSIAGAKRNPEMKFAVLFLDFDRFKVVNDSLGHEVGDLLLVEIANRLRTATRDSDMLCLLESTAARLGGDEFVLLLESFREHHDVIRVAERMLQALAAPYQIKGHLIHSTASIGITTSAGGYASAEDMLRDADTAMYRAKAAGKARFVLFDQQMHSEAVARLTLENDIRKAIEQKELRLVYQPIVSLITHEVSGYEALLRWKHPLRGNIPPLDFIPLAEEIGEIIPIGAWVLTEACRQLADWRRRCPTFANVSISVNLSRRQLTSPELVPHIRRTLEETGLSGSSLKLEITESVIMEDAKNAVRVLQQIRDLGIDLHVDDFGTGYSSLSCLHRFPINGLKIDRAFVTNVGERHDYAAVVNAIISLAHNLHIQLIAEGVETAEQVALLQGLDCDQAQGFYFARPLDVAAAEAFIMNQQSLAA